MDSQSDHPRSSKYVNFIVFVVNLSSLSAGMSIGWTSPVLPKLTNPDRIEENPIGRVITNDEASWITAALMLGPLFGTYPWAILSDTVGRKRSFVLVGLPMSAAYVALAFSRSVLLLSIARFTIGFAFGGAISVLFVYVGEIADVKSRGMLLSCYENFLTFGLVCSYVLGAYLSVVVFNLIAAVIPMLFFFLFGVFGVESPVFLLKKDKREDAYRVLRKLRDTSEESLEKEMNGWEMEIKTREMGTIKDLLSDRVLIKSLTIAIALTMFQQLTGINAILSYAQSIFEEAGGSLPSEICAIIIGTIQFLSSFTSVLFVDRFGRKLLLVLSATGMVLTLAVLGACFDSTSTWLPLAALTLFIVSYNVGFSVLPYTIMGEIFPSKVRSVAAATAGLANNAMAFAVSLLFGRMKGLVGDRGTFWVFGGFCVLAAVFVLVAVPETKGKSLELIHKELRD